MTDAANPYAPFIQLLNEIGTAQNAGATVAALTMVYVGIDTMALLACPAEKKSQTRSDFINWVDRYLKADAASEYQYAGIDVYAARCAVLHSYGSTASLHDGPTPPMKFGYLDNGPHRKDDAERFALISVAIFIHDFSKAVEQFLGDVMNDAELKSRVDSRLPSLFLVSLLDH